MFRTRQNGFTLVELLVVIAIIGTLAAIAIPAYRYYKVRGFNSMAQSDLRGGIFAEEAAYIDQGTYVPCGNAIACEGVLPGLRTSKEDGGATALQQFEFTGDADTFTGRARHEHGSITHFFDKDVGAIQPE